MAPSDLTGQHDFGIAVLKGPHQWVSLPLPCPDSCPTTGFFTLLDERQVHVVAGGCGVQFEDRRVKLLLGRQRQGARCFQYAPPSWVNSI